METAIDGMTFSSLLVEIISPISVIDGWLKAGIEFLIYADGNSNPPKNFKQTHEMIFGASSPISFMFCSQLLP